MFEWVEKVIANDFVVFNTATYENSDDFLTQQQFISFPLWDWLELFRYTLVSLNNETFKFQLAVRFK